MSAGEPSPPGRGGSVPDAQTLEPLLAEIRACRVCAPGLPHEPRPVVQLGVRARILIVGQAPGVRVHASGVPFTDPSGVRLREWLGVDEGRFYDPDAFAIAPSGFCFPGLDAKGSDLPPRRDCAPLWQARVLDALPNLALIVLVGGYAQAIHLGARARGGVTRTVAAWREFAPRYAVTPHPSWRNSGWLKRHPWFETELLPNLRARVSACLERSF